MKYGLSEDEEMKMMIVSVLDTVSPIRIQSVIMDGTVSMETEDLYLNNKITNLKAFQTYTKLPKSFHNLGYQLT